MIPELAPSEYDPENILSEDQLTAITEAITAFEASRIDLLTQGASKNYIKGTKTAYERVGKKFSSDEVKDDIFSFLKTYKKQLREGYTIIQGEKNYWLRNRTIDERQKIFDIISKGVTEGKTPTKAAKEFQDYFGMQKREAVTLARTETAYVQANGRDDRYKKFGVKKVKWLLGKNPCEICIALGGKILDLDDPEARQPKHPRCTCDLSPVLE